MNYASGASYHPSGQLTAVSYGNGLSYSASYNARQQMTDLIVSRTGLNALDFSYNYDANGRVTLVTDHAVSGQNRSFSYDGLGRLATASGPWGAGSYTYDLLNNIRSKTLGPHTVEIEYNADNQIHRARDTRDGNIWRLYGHDARGNVIDNSRLQFTYDRSDQPTAISGAASGSFVYDAHNRRVKQTINGETIYTVYSLSGAILYRDNVTAGEATDYIRMGGRTIARLTNGVATYPHSDHLGSAAAATDASGNLLWREDYTPFGEPRQAPAGNADDEGFTGHIHDADTGLTYMQARYYDPVIGRFLSNDPVGFALAGPAYFNRYAYTLNDPINLVDLAGMCGSRIKDKNGDNHVAVSCVKISDGRDTRGGQNENKPSPLSEIHLQATSIVYANVDFALAAFNSGVDSSLNISVETVGFLPSGISLSLTTPENYSTDAGEGGLLQMGANLGYQYNDLSGFHSPATVLVGDIGFVGGSFTLPTDGLRGAGGDVGVGLGLGAARFRTQTQAIVAVRTPWSPGFREHGLVETVRDE